MALEWNGQVFLTNKMVYFSGNHYDIVGDITLPLILGEFQNYLGDIFLCRQLFRTMQWDSGKTVPGPNRDDTECGTITINFFTNQGVMCVRGHPSSENDSNSATGKSTFTIRDATIDILDIRKDFYTQKEESL